MYLHSTPPLVSSRDSTGVLCLPWYSVEQQQPFSVFPPVPFTPYHIPPPVQPSYSEILHARQVSVLEMRSRGYMHSQCCIVSALSAAVKAEVEGQLLQKTTHEIRWFQGLKSTYFLHFQTDDFLLFTFLLPPPPYPSPLQFKLCHPWVLISHLFSSLYRLILERFLATTTRNIKSFSCMGWSAQYKITLTRIPSCYPS